MIFPSLDPAPAADHSQVKLEMDRRLARRVRDGDAKIAGMSFTDAAASSRIERRFHKLPAAF